MADQIGNLAYKLTVDNSNFSSGLARSANDLRSFSDRARADSARFEASFARLGDSAKDIFSGFTAGGPAGALSSIAGQASGLASKFVEIAGLGGTFALGFVGGLYAIGAAADSTAKKLNDINKLARGIGESGQNTQILQRVLEQGGFDEAGQQQVLLRFFDKLGDIRANPNGAGADAFKQLGLDPQALAAQSPAAAFGQTITALNGVTNVYDRAALSQQIFGRAFTDLEPIIRRGARGLQEASADVAAFGAGTATLAAVQEAASINRNLARDNREVSGRMSRGYADTAAGIALATARGRQNINAFAQDLVNFGRLAVGLREVNFNARPATAPLPAAVPFDAAALAAQQRTEAANTSARNLAREWATSAANVGLTARQIAIAGAQQSGASASLVSELRSRDAILSNLERRNNLEREMQGLLTQNASAAFRFQDSLNRIGEAALNNRQQATLLGASFRQLEQSIGLGGRESFAMDGVRAGSVEAARIQADIATRRNNGVDNVQNRILQALEIANQIAAARLVEDQAIAEALRSAPGLGIAPLRD